MTDWQVCPDIDQPSSPSSRESVVHEIIKLLFLRTRAERINWLFKSNLNVVTGYTIYSCTIKNTEYNFGQFVSKGSIPFYLITVASINEANPPSSISITWGPIWDCVYNDARDLFELVDRQSSPFKQPLSVMQQALTELSELCPHCLKEPRSQHINGDCP